MIPPPPVSAVTTPEMSAPAPPAAIAFIMVSRRESAANRVTCAWPTTRSASESGWAARIFGVIKLDEKRWQAVQVEHREGTQLNIYGPWVVITDATLYSTLTAAIQRGLGRAWPPPRR